MNIAIIVAAGSSVRLNKIDKLKQFLPINGIPLMIHTIKTFQNHEDINSIVVVTKSTYVEQVKLWCEEYKLNKVISVVEGGSSRQESVYNGLLKAKEISTSEEDIVLIHDAARPLVSYKIITNNIKECLSKESVVTAIKASDTTIRSNNSLTIEESLNRDELYQIQTPQTFKLNLILSAHEHAKNNGISSSTDDGSLMRLINKDVYLVEGSKHNFKITTYEDLILLEAVIDKYKDNI